MALTLETKIEQLAGVGPKMSQRFKKLGIESVSDLLFHYPIRYDDFSHIKPIGQIGAMGQMEPICIKGKILQIRNQRSPKGRMFLTHALIADDSGSIKAVWFNQPFLTRTLRKGEEYVFAGRIAYQDGSLVIKNPSYEREARILPVYPETQGLTSKYIRKIIKPLLFLTKDIVEYLPEEVRASQNLITLYDAINQIHFPESHTLIQKAKERLAFDELFLIQLKMLKIKRSWQKLKAPAMKFDKELIRSMVAKLPFKLTNAQRRAAWEIIGDLTGRHQNQRAKSKNQKEEIPPMNRLLEGDVGSGKTVVAAIAMFLVAKNGYQSAFMAPTEILAIQHYRTLTNLLLDFGLNLALFTHGKNELNGQKEKRGVMVKKIRNGEIDIAIGTHALLQSEIRFPKLGLAIVDEQHRFGIRQRAMLRSKSKTVPHLLSMSATPIPRTLSLALYGDLDLSILDEMPQGRQKVATYLIPPEKRGSAYGFIKKQIKEGRQVFVICPLIEESDRLGVKSATEEYERLKKEVFPELKIGLLHGRMKTKEKESIMEGFKKGKYNILVSTAVVEVGVDVPNATIMMIEGAERFGLAQLHQFRGRVGRGKYKSYCFLFTEKPSDKTIKRLTALVRLDDGFKLAEKDLELRGPGELYGTRQHGFLDLKMASLTDVKTIKRAREEAERLVERGLENYPTLIKKLEEFDKERRLE